MIRAGIIVLFFFVSCSQKTKLPHTILPPGKMGKILLDVLRADEFFNQRSADSIIIDSFNRKDVYRSVFEFHKISKNDFKRSLTFYQSHPDLMKIVLDSMHRSVNTAGVKSKISSRVKKILVQ